MITAKLRIIIVEDNDADKVLIERQIKKIVAHPSIVHISELDVLKYQLNVFNPDVVLSDYALNGFTGLDVLEYISNTRKSIPLIFITGTINDEEIAASTILTGAKGYILKKNINSLHKKLKPYFEKIIEGNKMTTLTKGHSKVITEMEDYLATVRADNEMIVASFLEMKKALEKIKSTM